jgi:uncharacterized protein (DUF488 family)
VRSVPSSRIAPDFDRFALDAALRAAGIKYVFLGDKLGGRSKLARDYDETGRVRYERMATSPSFDDGINRVFAGAERSRVVLLCAEKEPLDCHRTLLVGRGLEKRGAQIAHIHADGHLETNNAAMSRLLSMHGMQEDALFESRERQVDRACELQARRVAFVDKRMQSAAPVA